MVRTRDVQCLSFPLTVSTLLTSTSWVLYGLQLSDCYIMVRRVCNHVPPSAKPAVSNALHFSSPAFLKPQVPNLPGILTSLIRFFLFWKFGSANQNSPSYKPLRIWGGRKNFMPTGWREAPVIGPVNPTESRHPSNVVLREIQVMLFEGQKFIFCWFLLEPSVVASVASWFSVSH